MVDMGDDAEIADILGHVVMHSYQTGGGSATLERGARIDFRGWFF